MKAICNFCFIDEINKAKETIRIVQDMYTEDIIETLQCQIKEKLNNSKKVILYGTGEIAKKLYKLLVFYELDLEYFVTVTELDLCNHNFFGMEIKEIKNFNLAQYLNLPVIVASKKYFDSMKKYAENMGFLKIISGEDILELML